MKKTSAFMSVLLLELYAGVFLFAQESSLKADEDNLLFSEQSSSAETETFFDSFTFSISPLVSMRWGCQNEYVFTENSAGDTVKLSELNWDENNIVFGGVDFSAAWKDFKLDAKVQAAAPMNCGFVQDSDWFNVIEYASDSYYVPVENTLNSEISSIKTNYSVSTCKLNYFYFCSTQFKYDFKILKNLSLSPIVGFDYSYSCFSAMGGTFYYGDYNSTDQYFYSYESASPYSASDDYEVLSLTRENIITWIGLSTKFSPAHFDLNLDLSVSPYIFVNSLDSHPMRSKYFLDRMQGFFSGIKADFNSQFNFNSNHHLFLDISFTGTLTLYGKSYQSSSLTETFYRSAGCSAGCSFFFFDASAGYRFTF